MQQVRHHSNPYGLEGFNDPDRYTTTRRRWGTYEPALDLVISWLADRAETTQRQADRELANAQQRLVDDAARRILAAD